MKHCFMLVRLTAYNNPVFFNNRFTDFEEKS